MTHGTIRLVVHGGAGGAGEGAWPEATAEPARDTLRAALRAGHAVLAAGGPAIAAVVEAVAVLEDCPLFNAGRGAVLRADGTVAFDASVMCGRTGSAGAVASITKVRNPVRAAEALRRDARHLMLVGDAAVHFARERGLALESDAYFVTEARREHLRTTLASGKTALDHGGPGETVGAVALDLEGHVAAATSTGGVTAAWPGRVGDSPIIGAGTWASDRGVAVSATGMGEAFIRASFAHEVDAHVRLTGASLEDALSSALDEVERQGGTGGCIALTPTGHLAHPFRTALMPRGTIDESAQPRVALGAEPLG